MEEERSDAFVFFGATGDLAFKQIFPALLALIRDDDFDVPIVGVSRSSDLDSLRARARASIGANGDTDPDALALLLDRLRYVKGSHDDIDTFHALRRELGAAAHPLHYLAIPPELFGVVIANLETSGCAEGARVIFEKPFGRDLASARMLHAAARAAFTESAIFRIDHFLGLEPVQNLLYFRFANAFMEPIWDHDHIASVEITLAEAFDVGTRGTFYDSTGAIRDVIQNHLFQVLSLLCMEPPPAPTAAAISSEKDKLLSSIRPLAVDDVVRGQYVGYLDVDGVAPDSTVETFAAVRLAIDSARWAGVPFFIRTGKSLEATVTEILVTLKPPPHNVFDEGDPPDGDYLRFRLRPDLSISLGARTKRSGDTMVGEAIELFACHQADAGRPPYQRLIGDAARGDQTLFASQGSIEAAWKVVDAVLDDATPIHGYDRGNWGPPEADLLLGRGERWHKPQDAIATTTERRVASTAATATPPSVTA